MKFCSGLRTKK